MADTVPAMLEPGEFVIRKDAAEEIGIDNLNMLNNVDRSSQMYMNNGGFVPQLQHGHSAIDELLAINTLNNQDNVDMTRQTGMFNKGGQAKSIKDLDRYGIVPKPRDPLQIDARMRREFSDVGTIGMVDSSASLGQMLDKIQQDNAMRKHLERRYGDKPETLRAHLEVRKDDFMPQEEMMRWLNYAAKQTQPKPDTIRGYQDGGTVTYGSQTLEVPSLADIYDDAGLTPIDEQADKFKEYDISEEEGILSQFGRTAGNLRAQGAKALGQATQQAQIMGGGFAGFGGRQASMDTTRRGVESQYETGIDSALQTKFEQQKSMRDAYKVDQLNLLTSMQDSGGSTTDEENKAANSVTAYMDSIGADGHFETDHIEIYESEPLFLKWIIDNSLQNAGAKWKDKKVRSYVLTDKQELARLNEWYEDTL